MMQLNTCILSDLLTRAKDAHTRYERRFTEQGDTPPDHKWEDWYARYIMHELAEQEVDAKWRGLAADPLEVVPSPDFQVNRFVKTIRDQFADVTGPQPGDTQDRPASCPWGSAP